MVNVEYSEAMSEVLDILDHTREEDVNKISPEFMNILRENASKTYKPKLDHTKKLVDMQLKRKTYAILAVIYKKFWCNSEQLEEFNKILRENDIKHEQELREKYNPSDIFKTTKPKVEDLDNSTNMVQYNQSFIQKLINKIKSIFSKK